MVSSLLACVCYSDSCHISRNFAFRWDGVLSLSRVSGRRVALGRVRLGEAIEFQFMAKLMYLPATFDCLLNASISREALSHFSEKWSHSPVYGVTRSNASGIRQTRVLLVTICLNSVTPVIGLLSTHAGS